MSRTESPASARIDEIIDLLWEAHPDAACELLHENPFQLLVATILSAQCTDVRVNQVTPTLFETLPTPEAMAKAPREQIEELIRSTGFFRQKARFLQEASQAIVSEFGGEVPAEMDQLLTLTGVARKTANVVLGVAYRKAEGIVVDTHVRRLSQRLGLTRADNPEIIERELVELVPRESWIDFSHLLIFHGRRVCKARKPLCNECILNHLCPSAILNTP